MLSRFEFSTASRPQPSEMRWRFWFSLATVFVTLVLISWGGFVTSIDAGLAVPDWPATFGSLDPFGTGYVDPDDPTARWWHNTPVLAEHGHRLLGALVGLMVLTLAFWTWRADHRRWMRILGGVALVLVSLQGVLGGLRVIWLSLDLAMVHAFTAQIFFSLLVAMTLFTSRSWMEHTFSVGRRAPAAAVRTTRLLAAGALGALYLQIILGALLRHPGLSVDPLFAGTHIVGAFIVTGLIFATFSYIWRHVEGARYVRTAAWWMLGMVVWQFAMGLGAFTVILYEAPAAVRSVMQVVLASGHVTVGSLLVGSTVAVLLYSLRRPVMAQDVAPAPATHRTAPAAREPMLAD